MRLNLITYGMGDIKPEMVDPIQNRCFIKPDGGLWASPVGSKYGWKEWCLEENFDPNRIESSFTFQYEGNILVIDSEGDLNKLTWEALSPVCSPDFEQMLNDGVDAIWLTEKGQWETRLTHPKNLYGWDYERVLIMNPNGIIIADRIYKRVVKRRNHE